MIPRRLLCLAGTLVLLSGPALADPPASAPPASAASDGGPVSTASESTDAKIAKWLNQSQPIARTHADEPVEDMAPPRPDRKIHGEVGAAVGSDGYRSFYGVANIPLGKSSSATVAISTARGPWPLVAGGGWYAGPFGPVGPVGPYDPVGSYDPVGALGPAGPDRGGCICRQAPDGSTQCRPAGAVNGPDADPAEACQPN